MSDGPLFPKKSETSEEPTTGSQVVIERSDDASPATGGPSETTSPSVQSKRLGCGSSVFVLLLVVALVAVGRAVL